jgi:hypothetical protein
LDDKFRYVVFARFFYGRKMINHVYDEPRTSGHIGMGVTASGWRSIGSGQRASLLHAERKKAESVGWGGRVGNGVQRDHYHVSNLVLAASGADGEDNLITGPNRDFWNGGSLRPETEYRYGCPGFGDSSDKKMRALPVLIACAALLGASLIVVSIVEALL